MKSLGFTATDAKAYLALVKNSPATGYELATRSGVPRSAIYGVLKRLEALGLVNPIQDKPVRYVPLAPERLYLTEDDWTAALSGRPVHTASTCRPRRS